MKWIWLAGILAVPCVLAVATHSVASRHRGLQRGEMLPVSTLRAADGSMVSTEAWRGSPTLLVLFRPTCGVCKAEIRALSAMAPSLEGTRVALVSLDPGPVPPGLPFPVYVDPEGAFVRRTQRLLVPTVYHLDAAGRVAYSRMGARRKSEELKLPR